MKYRRMGRRTSETADTYGSASASRIEPPPESPVPEVPEEANTARDVAKDVLSDGQHGESGPLPESGAAGTSATYPDTAYSIRSGRVPVRPAKFNDFIMN